MSELKEDQAAQQQADRRQMFQLITGHWVVQAIAVAAELGIADLLVGGPRTPQQLAEDVAADEDTLARLLRFLANVGILVEDGDGRFACSRLGDHLRRDHPQSFRALAIMEGDEFYQAWGQLRHSVKTGERGFDKAYGMPLFDYLAAHPARKGLFYEWIENLYGMESPVIASAYDFSPFHTIVDVGGGEGDLLCEILRRNTDAQGVIFDLPMVVENTGRKIAAAGLEARCRRVAGSFFESVPEGGDAYILRHTIHDWNDEQAGIILKNCHRVMAKTARLLILDAVIPPGNEWFAGKLLDVNMLIVSGGRERTRAQFESLLSASGFELTGVVPTPLPRVSIVEARPI